MQKRRFAVMSMIDATIAALKIAAAVKQVDPRDVLEDLVEKNLADFVALAIKKKP